MGISIDSLRRRLRDSPTCRVHISTQACLGSYRALLQLPDGSLQVITSGAGSQPISWPSLAEARRALRRAGVIHAELQVEVSHDQVIGRI